VEEEGPADLQGHRGEGIYLTLAGAATSPETTGTVASAVTGKPKECRPGSRNPTRNVPCRRWLRWHPSRNDQMSYNPSAGSPAPAAQPTRACLDHRLRRRSRFDRHPLRSPRALTLSISRRHATSRSPPWRQRREAASSAFQWRLKTLELGGSATAQGKGAQPTGTGRQGVTADGQLGGRSSQRKSTGGAPVDRLNRQRAPRLQAYEETAGEEGAFVGSCLCSESGFPAAASTKDQFVAEPSGHAEAELGI